jgi:hypothetical protein
MVYSSVARCTWKWFTVKTTRISSVANLDHNSPHERQKYIGNYHVIKVFIHSSACTLNVTWRRVRATIVAMGK